LRTCSRVDLLNFVGPQGWPLLTKFWCFENSLWFYIRMIQYLHYEVAREQSPLVSESSNISVNRVDWVCRNNYWWQNVNFRNVTVLFILYHVTAAVVSEKRNVNFVYSNSSISGSYTETKKPRFLFFAE
jgi:hypothetical protein